MTDERWQEYERLRDNLERACLSYDPTDRPRAKLDAVVRAALEDAARLDWLEQARPDLSYVIIRGGEITTGDWIVGTDGTAREWLDAALATEEGP